MRQPLRHTLGFGIILTILILSACTDSSYVEIYTPSTTPTVFKNIIIEGDVELPGVYPLKVGDTIESLLKAAGGTVDSSTIRLVVGDGMDLTQKVNLNTAPTWLLNALPGVGDAKATAIIEYRTSNGPYINIMELMKVPGFGQTLFDSLKDLITVTG